MTSTWRRGEGPAQAADQQQAGGAQRRLEQRRTLAVAAAGTMLVLVGFTTPLAILPSTARGLRAGTTMQTWLLSSIGLGLAAALLTAGVVADDYGRRRMFLVGTWLVAAGSAVCAAAPSALVFVVGRVIEGVGGAAVVASALGLIGHVFPDGAARRRAAGVWGACVGAGTAVGPLLAAALQSGWSWRAAYWAPVGLEAVVGIAGARLLTESRAAEPKPVDRPGVLLLTGALSCLLAGLTIGRDGWSHRAVWLLLGAATMLTAGFVRAERRAPEPMLDLGLFRRPPFVAATVAAFATGAGPISLMVYLPTFAQRSLGAGAVASALLLFVFSGTSVFAALAVRRLPARAHARGQMAAGLAVGAAGLALLARTGERTPLAALVPGLLVIGLGYGVLNAALGREAVGSVPPGRGSMGSGANNTARYVGTSVGVAVVVAVATARAGAGLVAGWDTAALVTSAASLLGAVVVLACRARGRRPATDG